MERKYTIQKYFTDGGHSKIFFGIRNEDKLPVVIKFTRYTLNDSGIPNEVCILEKLKGVYGICQMYEWFELDEKECIIIMERKENVVDLTEYIITDENIAIKILKNIFNIVLELDSLNLVHGDLKLDNILVNKHTHEITIIDFGASFYKDNPVPFHGTWDYLPPEFFINKNNVDIESVTIWSLGIILYGMLFDDLPFRDKKGVMNQQLNYSKNTEKTQTLLRCMLLKDPICRYRFEDLKIELGI